MLQKTNRLALHTHVRYTGERATSFSELKIHIHKESVNSLNLQTKTIYAQKTVCHSIALKSTLKKKLNSKLGGIHWKMIVAVKFY